MFLRIKAASVVFLHIQAIRTIVHVKLLKIEIVSEPYTDKCDHHMPLMDAGCVFNLNNINIPQKEGFLATEKVLTEQYRRQ